MSDSSKKRNARVFLVGAGPGDPELITLRGKRLLDICDVLVYDNLVAPELVEQCPAAVKKYVGKSSGGHSLGQDEINRLLVTLATSTENHRVIVRLKGGDPCVFGRGGEEAEFCRDHDVPVVIVPGITAGVAGPASYGIPVTHRATSRGVTFVTGHLSSDEEIELPWEQLARLEHTLVIYMGVGTLEKISSRLIDCGLDPQTPAAMIQESTMTGERAIFAPICDLAKVAAENNIRPPAITIIGNVTELAPEPKRRARPLAGKTIMLARAEERVYPELVRLRATGARVLDVPVIRCEPRIEDEEIRQLSDTLPQGAYVLFTSALAARFFDQIVCQPPTRDRFRFIAASPVVSDQLRLMGYDVAIEVEVMGSGKVLAALKEAGIAKSTEIFMPRAALADATLPDALTAAGFTPRPIVLYDTLPVPPSADATRSLADGRIDLVMLLSGSTVDSLISAVPGLAQSGVKFAAIGQKTAKIANSAGLTCDILPDQPTMPSLVDAVIEALSPNNGGEA
jgi:uroporphyrinogen III methyltransferase / synthase